MIIVNDSVNDVSNFVLKRPTAMCLVSNVFGIKLNMFLSKILNMPSNSPYEEFF